MIATYRNAIRLFSREARLVLFTATLTGFSYLGISTMLLNLYLLRLGYGLEFIGLINAVAQLTFAMFSLPAGALGSRWGCRRASILGLSISVIAFGLLPLAEVLPLAWQTGWLMMTYLTVWFGGALYLVNSYPLLMQVTSPAERYHAFSVRQALLPLGNFLGSLMGGFLPWLIATLLATSLEQPGPYRYGLWLAAVALVPGVLALRSVQEVNLAPRQERTAIADPAPFGLIAFMALIMFLYMAAIGVVNTFFNVYLDDHFHVPAPWIGGLAATGQLLAIPLALVTPLAVARWGKRQTIIIGILGLTFSLLPLALAPHWGVAGLGFIGVNALAAFITPALLVCQQEIVPSGWRPAMSGAIVMARGLGTAMMAFGGGYMITIFGYPSLFLTGAVLAALGAGLFWAYSWMPRWFMTRQILVRAN